MQEIRDERKRMACKVTLQKMAEYKALGFEFIFTDGSAKTTEGIRAVRGYGCHRPEKLGFYTFLPIREKQTRNRAALYAVIQAGDKATSKVVIVTDSEYVYKGVNNWSHKWRKNGRLTPRDRWKTRIFG